MNKKKQNRRYYLHGKVKAFCRINVRARSLFVAETDMQNFTDRQQKYFNELKQNFNYNVQLEIPE